MNTIKYFAVSDVHSYYDPMMKALTDRGFEIDNPNHKVIICGDLFDRGPDTLKCFEFVKKLADEGRLEYVMGNHEDLLVECLSEIYSGMTISRYHDSNGTLDTIAHFCGCSKYDIYCGVIRPEVIKEAMTPVVEFLRDNCIDFVEIGGFIFVHGWVPVTINNDKMFYNLNRKDVSPHHDWENATEDEWYIARWLNGMDMWKGKTTPHRKTVVCGHWHCSWGWSHLRQERGEFPPTNRKDWQKSFEPFIDDGIMAIDACTHYTGIVNCLLFDVHEDGVDFIVDN